MAKRSPTCEVRDDASIVVKSDDGSICILLRMTRFGLWVRRERRRARERARLIQSIVFNDSRRFEHWCDGDSIRFDYPIVSSRVKREGSALLDGHGRTFFAASDHPAA